MAGAQPRRLRRQRQRDQTCAMPASSMTPKKRRRQAGGGPRWARRLSARDRVARAAFDALRRRRRELVALRRMRPNCSELAEPPWSQARAHVASLRQRVPTWSPSYRAAHAACEAWICDVEGLAWFVGAPSIDLILESISQLDLRGSIFFDRLAPVATPARISNARTGVLESPHRSLLWRRWRIEEGLPDDRIAVRWLVMTTAWARGAAPARKALVYPAYREWATGHRPVAADLWDATVQHALAKLERLLESWWDAQKMRFRGFIPAAVRDPLRETELDRWLSECRRRVRSDRARARALTPSRSALVDREGSVSR